ncbi:hypothetical protein PWT90_01770 [Aphanocladium album]|nr:hypothetical protein PWT90_01770 [Aphanocladium album]
MSALKFLGRVTGSSARKGASCTKQFSTTTARGIQGRFIETENAELNQVLKTIQEKNIFPAYLPEPKRKIVFNPRKTTFLQSNPIIIEVDGVEHRFSTIDAMKGIPNSKKTFNEAMRLMETPEDWENLPILLAGYQKSNIALHNKHFGKIIRRAEETGNIYTVIECAKQVEKTGFKLKTHEMAVRLLAAINDKIVHNGAAATEQAVKWMEVTLDLLYRHERLAQKDVTADKGIHKSQVAHGLVLFTRASAVSTKQAAGEDAAAELILLKDQVEVLKSQWKSIDLKDLGSDGVFATLSPLSSSAGKNLNGAGYVRVIAQNIKAISLARELVPAEANELSAVETALSEHLTQYATSDKGRDGRWAEIFQQVTGSAPSWPQVASKPAQSSGEAAA